MHPDKTRIVYCKDGKRCGSYGHTSFTFLGYGFRVRKVKSKRGKFFFGFNPAISDGAAKQIRAQIRRWRLHLRSGSTLEQLAREINPAVASHGGWVELIDVKKNNVYIRLGGGCQGCGAADVTLKQGIEKAIRELAPSVGEILDTTDHAAGRNPYYSPAK